MIGAVGYWGTPSTPWHAPQSAALSSIESAQAALAPARSAATTTLRNMQGFLHAPTSRPSARGDRSRSNEKAATPGLRSGGGGQRKLRTLLDREGDDVVAALGVDLGVAARTDDDILLAVDHVGRRGRIDARAGLELPEHFTVGVVVSFEPAVGLAGEEKAAGCDENAADHRLRRLNLPGDFPGVVIDRADVAEALLARNDRKRAAEP